METQVLAVAPGYDLEPAKAAIQTILDAARVEVELNQANLLAQFDVRRIKREFTAGIDAAVTVDDVNAVVEGISAEIDAFTSSMDERMEGTLSIAR